MSVQYIHLACCLYDIYRWIDRRIDIATLLVKPHRSKIQFQMYIRTKVLHFMQYFRVVHIAFYVGHEEEELNVIV